VISTASLVVAINSEGGFGMSRNSEEVPRCEDCPLPKKAEAKPKSLLGRLWYWHIKCGAQDGKPIKSPWHSKRLD